MFSKRNTSLRVHKVYLGAEIVVVLVTMKLARRTLTLAVLGLLVFAIPASAQDGLAPGIYNPNESTPVHMYFHVNGIQDFPVNTQPPDDKYQQSEGLGTITHSQGCQDVPGFGLVSKTQHTFYGYSSPGYVEYDFDEGGKPRYHSERGISYDVQMDQSKDIEFTYYMESQLYGGDSNGANPNGLPLVTPQVVLRATVREGDDISVGHTALNEGRIIAQGQTAPHDLTGPAFTDTEEVQVVRAGNPTASESAGYVYKFNLKLPVDIATINKDESYNVRIDVFQTFGGLPCEDVQNDAYFMTDHLRVHTSPEFRPGMTWHAMNAIRIEYLHPQFIGDDLVIHTSSNSPWGNYDVRGDKDDESQGGLSVEVKGPSIPVSFNQVALTARTHEHDHHTEAVDATWVWEYKKDGAKDGLYTITMSVKNDQETAEAVAIAQFEVGSGKIVGCGAQEKGGGNENCEETVQRDGAKAVEESPGIGLVALLGALAAGGFALRRRN